VKGVLWVCWRVSKGFAQTSSERVLPRRLIRPVAVRGAILGILCAPSSGSFC